MIRWSDIDEAREFNDIIENYHTSKSNHRGINQTEKRLDIISQT